MGIRTGLALLTSKYTRPVVLCCLAVLSACTNSGGKLPPQDSVEVTQTCECRLAPCDLVSAPPFDMACGPCGEQDVNANDQLETNGGSEDLGFDLASPAAEAFGFQLVQQFGWGDLGLQRFKIPISLVLSPNGDEVYIAFYDETPLEEGAGTPLLVMRRDPESGLLEKQHTLLDTNPLADSYLWAADELVVDPGGRLLFVLRYSGTHDLTVLRLDSNSDVPVLAQQLVVPSTSPAKDVFTIDISPDGRHLYVGGQNNISIFAVDADAEPPVVVVDAIKATSGFASPGPKVKTLGFDSSGGLLWAYLEYQVDHVFVWVRDMESGHLSCHRTFAWGHDGVTAGLFSQIASTKTFPHEVLVSGGWPALQAFSLDGPTSWWPPSWREREYKEACQLLQGIDVSQVLTVSEASAAIGGGPVLAMALAPDGATAAMHMARLDGTGTGGILNNGAPVFASAQRSVQGKWELVGHHMLPEYCGRSVPQLCPSARGMQFSPDSRFVYSAGFHCIDPIDPAAPVVFVHERVPAEDI